MNNSVSGLYQKCFTYTLLYTINCEFSEDLKLELVEDASRTAVGLLDEITDKFTFMNILKKQNINHEDFVEMILDIIGIFEDSAEISKLRGTFNAKCIKPFGEKYDKVNGKAIKTTCVLILHSYITIEKYRDIIMGKLADVVKKAELLETTDTSKRVELSQLIEALTSVQVRRKSNLVNWIKTVPLKESLIKCSIFKLENDLWPGQQHESRLIVEDYIKNSLKLEIEIDSCQGKIV